MKITRFTIENFKTFNNVSFELNEKLNVFTGVNNTGKTTLLEAIALWNECFEKLLNQTKNKDAKLKLKAGDYRFLKNYYWHHSDIISVRSPDYLDIFYNFDDKQSITLKATFTDGQQTLIVGFVIKKARGHNYHIDVMDEDFDYATFNQFFKNFPQCISVVYASPLAQIQTDEDFVTDPIIQKYITIRESVKVIRNRLYKLRYRRDESFNDFQKDLSMILKNPVNLSIHTDKMHDPEVVIEITLSPKDRPKNIALVGSGTLQIIEILLAVYDNERPSDLNLILLDEPDSHIHRDIQKRLIDVLLRHSSKSQIFISSHNESLIRSTPPQHLFHLEPNASKTYQAIIHEDGQYRNEGLQPTQQIKILQALGGESSLDLLNALESEKLIFVEGKNDAKYLDIILSKKYRDKQFNIMYWSFDGIANIFKDLFSYKTLFSMIKNEKTLWEKSILVFDRDFFTHKQSTSLLTQLKTKLVIPVFGWSFYTFESVFLTDLDKFSRLIATYVNEEIGNSNRGTLHHHIAITPEEVKAQLSKAIDEIIEQKRAVFEGTSTYGELNKWIKDRREEFNKNDIQNNVLPDGTAYHDIITFHANELKNGRLASLATKEDIEDIIQKVIDTLGVTIDEPKSYFYELLNRVGASTWYEEWDKLIKIIENPNH